MRGWEIAIRSGVGVVAAAIGGVGLFGLDDDWTEAGDWLERLSEPQLRVILIVIAVLLVLTAVPWTRLMSRGGREEVRGDLNPDHGSSAQAIQHSPGSQQYQIGSIGIVLESDRSHSNARDSLKSALRRAKNALEAARAAISGEGTERAKRDYLLAIGEIKDIAEELSGGDALAALAADLGNVATNALQFTDAQYLGKFKQLENSIRSLPSPGFSRAQNRTEAGQVIAAGSSTPGPQSREADEIRTIRRQAGQISERLGDHGPPLSAGEDHTIRAALTLLRELTGAYAYRPPLRVALRDFVHHAAWMLEFKSEWGYHGLRHFSSAQEAQEARGNLQQATLDVLAACARILEREEPRATELPSSEEGLGVEVSVDRKLTFIGLLPCYSKPAEADSEESKKLEPDGTVVSAYFSRISVKNHDAAYTTVDNICLEVKDAEIVDTWSGKRLELEGERRIEARSSQDYRLRIDQLLDRVVPPEEAHKRISLAVKTLGLGTVRCTLDESLFQREGADW